MLTSQRFSPITLLNMPEDCSCVGHARLIREGAPSVPRYRSSQAIKSFATPSNPRELEPLQTRIGSMVSAKEHEGIHVLPRAPHFTKFISQNFPRN